MIEGEENTDAFVFTSLLVFPQHVAVLSDGAEQGMERREKSETSKNRFRE